MVAHLLFFQTHLAKLKTSKELPSHRTKTEVNRKRMTKIKHEPVTKAICNKGFRGNSNILPRIKFRVGGQESSP